MVRLQIYIIYIYNIYSFFFTLFLYDSFSPQSYYVMFDNEFAPVWFHLEAFQRVKEAIKFYSISASGFFVLVAD